MEPMARLVLSLCDILKRLKNEKSAASLSHNFLRREATGIEPDFHRAVPLYLKTLFLKTVSQA